jgi:steroid delta-isomerase-like uncharacterized protein
VDLPEREAPADHDPLARRVGKEAPLSAEENKAVVRRMLDELFNRGNLDLAEEIIASDFVEHDPNMPEDLHGPEEFKEYVAAYRSAFPDIHIAVEDQVAEEDKVATRWTGTGTHEGDLSGIAPTGIRTTVAGMDISRISGGKIAESWSSYDMMGLMHQLGVIPSPEEEAQA